VTKAAEHEFVLVTEREDRHEEDHEEAAYTAELVRP
jgi:hypothetical protein